jgi:hypothetical protein
LVFEKGILNPEVEGAAREVISGTKDEITRIWSRMVDDARDLGGDPDMPDSHENAKAVYGFLSPNSNSFWATVLRRSGFDYRDFHPSSRNWTPGTGIDLNDPVWWAPEFRWPGTAPTSADHLQRPLASYPQPARGLLSLMDEEQPPTPSPLGLLAYMDQSEMDEAITSPLRPDVYEGRRAPARFPPLR